MFARLVPVLALALACQAGARGALAQDSVAGVVDPRFSIDAETPAPGVGPIRGTTAEVAETVVPTGPPATARNEAVETAEAFGTDGIAVGSFLVFPTLRSSLGWTSNASGGEGGEDDTFMRTRAEVVLRSNFEAHEIEATLGAEYQRYLGETVETAPAFDAGLRGRFDIDEVNRIEAAARARRYREDSADPELEGNDPDTITTLGGGLAFERTAGIIGLAGGVDVDRTIYETSTDRTNTLFAGTLRASLESGGIIQPFVEVTGFRRLTDDRVDADGFERSSIGGTASVGARFDTGITTGSLAVGYGVEHLDDDALENIRGAVFEGTLAWRPSELTTVDLNIETRFEPTTAAGSSGSVVTAGGVAVTHSLLRNVDVTLAGTGSFQDYTGIEREIVTAGLRAGLAWRLNPSVELTLDGGYERVWGYGGAESYDEATIEAGVVFRP
jgi:hypothetical protein